MREAVDVADVNAVEVTVEVADSDTVVLTVELAVVVAVALAVEVIVLVFVDENVEVTDEEPEVVPDVVAVELALEVGVADRVLLPVEESVVEGELTSQPKKSPVPYDPVSALILETDALQLSSATINSPESEQSSDGLKFVECLNTASSRSLATVRQLNSLSKMETPEITRQPMLYARGKHEPRALFKAAAWAKQPG